MLTTKVNRNGTGIVTLLLITLKRKSPRISGNNKSSKNGCQKKRQDCQWACSKRISCKIGEHDCSASGIKGFARIDKMQKSAPKLEVKKTVLDSSERGEVCRPYSAYASPWGVESLAEGTGVENEIGETVSLNDEVDFHDSASGQAELPVPEAASNNSMPDVGDKENCETPNRATDDSSYPCSNQQKERGGE
ncbi:MAG: hypothetical protein R3E58_08685 [Phycisphaerae bacterium]